QRDQRRPARQAADEGPGAVDWVEAPHEAGVAALRAIFLADHAVIRVALGDQRAHRPLRAAIGLGDWIERAIGALVLARAVAPGGQRRPTPPRRQLHRERREGRDPALVHAILPAAAIIAAPHPPPPCPYARVEQYSRTHSM